MDEDLKPEERSQRDLALAVMHRHAAQMAAAAAAAAGLHGNAAHLANLAATVGGLGGLNLNQNAICQLNSALMGQSNSSPSGASGSSGSGVASSPALQSIEPGTGSTYEEQFKQVCHRTCLTNRASSVARLCTFPLPRIGPIGNGQIESIYFMGVRLN